MCNITHKFRKEGHPVFRFVEFGKKALTGCDLWGKINGYAIRRYIYALSAVLGGKGRRRQAVKKVIRDGSATHAFIAADAERRITAPIYELCEAHNVPVTEVSTMKELGSAVGIAVGAAVVTVID